MLVACAKRPDAATLHLQVLQVHPHPEPALSFVDLTSSTRLEGVRNKITSFALHALLRGATWLDTLRVCDRFLRLFADLESLGTQAYPCLGARLVGVFA